MKSLLEEHISISPGNIKMGSIPSISLPPLVTCAPEACKLCGKKCYARRMTRSRTSVREAYERNLRILHENPDRFWREVNASLALSSCFRFHVSGDIPDAVYLGQMISYAGINAHCQILCFTKKYALVNAWLEEHELPDNLHLIFSAWRGLPMHNPHSLPEAHVFYRDGFTTASDGAHYCSGNCTECAIEGKNCWVMQRGEQIIFKEH